MPVTLRPLRPDDAAHAGRIFFLAVHEGTRQHYGPAERRAWAGDTIDLPGWTARLADLTGLMAERDGEPVGFMTLNATGYIDLAFVLPSAAGGGIGSALLRATEAEARRLGARRMTTAASLVARPFFLRHGWSVEEEEVVTRRGVALRRFRMHKPLG